MNLMRREIGSALLVLIVAASLLAVVFGLPHFGMTVSMDTHGNKTVTDCTMGGMAQLCGTTPLEHLSSTLTMFTGIPVSGDAMALLLIAFMSVVFWLCLPRFAAGLPELQVHSHRARYREGVPFGMVLQEAYSSGVLNPKIY